MSPGPCANDMTKGNTALEIRLPQPSEVSEKERDDALGSYLMMFASLAVGVPIPLLNLVASVIYFLVNRKTSAFVAFHALQALLAHIPVVLLNAGAVTWLVANLVTHAAFWGRFLWYLLFVGIVNLVYIVWSIVALIHASKGRFFYMPVVGRLSFARYFGRGVREKPAPRVWENKPPEGF